METQDEPTHVACCHDHLGKGLILLSALGVDMAQVAKSLTTIRAKSVLNWPIVLLVEDAGPFIEASSGEEVKEVLPASRLRSRIRDALERGVSWMAWIQAGCLCPQSWDLRLVRALDSRPDLWAVSPLTEVDGSFARALRSTSNESFPSTFEQLDRLVMAFSCRRVHPIKRENATFFLCRLKAFSTLWCTDGIDERGPLLNGWDGRMGVCDHVVAHAPPRSIPSRRDDNRTIHRLACRVARAMKNRPEHDLYVTGSPKPVWLHVVHAWQGGIHRWLRDFIDHDQRCIHWVLMSQGRGFDYGRQFALFFGRDLVNPVRVLSIDSPIRASDLRNEDYARMIQCLVDVYGVNHVVISSLIGHSLDLFRIKLPATYVLHDLAPFELSHRYRPALRAGTALEASSIRPLARFFPDHGPEFWDVYGERLLDHLSQPHVRIVAPSDLAAQRLSRLLEPHEKEVTVIPHGFCMQVKPCFGSDATTAEKLRCVVLGQLSIEKGVTLLRESLAGLEDLVDLHLVGCGSLGRAFRKHPGVTVVEQYDAAELPSVLNGIRPHVGLLLSLTMETFSYTLSELWAAGIPAVAVGPGNFGDRLQHGVTGLYLKPEVDDVIRAMRRLHKDRPFLKEMHGNVMSIPRVSCQAMVQAYHRVLGDRSENKAMGDYALDTAFPMFEPRHRMREVLTRFTGNPLKLILDVWAKRRADRACQVQDEI